MTHEALEDEDEMREIVRRTPLGRIGYPSDIGAAVRMLLSPTHRGSPAS